MTVSHPFLAVFAMLGITWPSSAQSSLRDRELAVMIGKELRQRATRELFSGTVLVTRRSKPIFSAALGEAEKTFGSRNRIDTKFNLGSMNKMFTAVAVGQLHERGRLNLDDTIDRYLGPEWLAPEQSKRITVRHLLTHRSGLHSYFNKAFFDASRLRYRAVSDFAPLIRDDVPSFAPGSRFSYSNSGYMLLGAIIERVTGKAYADVIEELITRPLGMTDTGSFEADAAVPNLATGYYKFPEGQMGLDNPPVTPDTWRKAEALRSDPTKPWRNNLFIHVVKGGPAGGGYSTVGDLIKFAEALRSNRLISASTRDLFWTSTGSDAGYGYGFEVRDGMVGHHGGFIGLNGALNIYTGSDINVAILGNYTGAATLTSMLIDTVIREGRLPPDPSSSAAATNPNLESGKTP